VKSDDRDPNPDDYDKPDVLVDIELGDGAGNTLFATPHKKSIMVSYESAVLQKKTNGSF
jgi:hypothetical protein